MKYSDFLAQENLLSRCGFCDVSDDMIIMQNEIGYVTPALAPYGSMHALIVPWDHVESLLDLSIDQQYSLFDLARLMTQSFYAQGAQEVVQLLRDSCSFVEGVSSTSGKSRKHLHVHIVGDVQIMPKMTQEESDSRPVLTDDQMKARTLSYRSGL